MVPPQLTKFTCFLACEQTRILSGASVRTANPAIAADRDGRIRAIAELMENMDRPGPGIAAIVEAACAKLFPLLELVLAAGAAAARAGHIVVIPEFDGRPGSEISIITMSS